MAGYLRFYLQWLMLVFIIQDVLSTVIELMPMSNSTCSRSSRKNPISFSRYDNYEIIWNGEQLPSNCDLVFKGESYTEEDKHTKYKICVKSFKYNVTDCNFLLTIQGNQLRKLNKEMRCGTDPIAESCSQPGEPLYIEFVKTSVTGDNHIVLFVTAEPCLDYDWKNTGIVIGIILGITLLVAVAVLITVLLCLRLRYLRSRKQFPSSTNKTPIDMMYHPQQYTLDYDVPYEEENRTESKSAPLSLFTVPGKEGAINPGFDASEETNVKNAESGKSKQEESGIV